jgi:hypothetical protein
LLVSAWQKTIERTVEYPRFVDYSFIFDMHGDVYWPMGHDQLLYGEV